MIKKTKQYDMFIFRPDNAHRICQAHVAKIKKSIESKNLLEFKPILIDEKMGIVDGQHRLLAAKELGVYIYYENYQSSDPKDLIRLNVNKTWKSVDYLNFYVSHGFEEYIKLKEFCDKSKLSIVVAFNLLQTRTRSSAEKFKAGEFVFDSRGVEEGLELCWETIAEIKKTNGFSLHLSSSRFWKALIALTQHPDFNEDTWMNRLKMKVTNITPKSSFIDYLKTLVSIYNFRNPKKIALDDLQVDVQ